MKQSLNFLVTGHANNSVTKNRRNLPTAAGVKGHCGDETTTLRLIYELGNQEEGCAAIPNSSLLTVAC